MTPERKADVLFWIKVSLGLTGMLLMFGILVCLVFFTIAQIRTLDENRARDKAMLQQHYEAMADHARAREQHALAFEAMMDRLGR